MSTGPIDVTESAPSAAAVVRSHVRTAEIPAFLSTAFDSVLRHLEQQRRAPAGPPFARWTPTPDGFDVEAGFPATASVEPEGDVLPVVLPGGAVATAMHRGTYETVGETYAAVADWLTAHGYRQVGEAWESYLDDLGVPEPRTVVSVPCRRG